MCKAPKPPKPKEPEKPEYLRNPYLDAAIGRRAAVDQLRTGRSSLRIDRDSTSAPSGNRPVVSARPGQSGSSRVTTQIEPPTLFNTRFMRPLQIMGSQGSRRQVPR